MSDKGTHSDSLQISDYSLLGPDKYSVSNIVLICFMYSNCAILLKYVYQFKVYKLTVKMSDTYDNY